MTKMKGKKQEAPLNSEMNSEVIDIPCNFCSKVFSSKLIVKVHCESLVLNHVNMTFPTRSPSRRQSMNVVYVYTEGCSPSMRSICCLSTRSLTSPLHCVREKKESYMKPVSSVISDAMISSLAGLKLRWEFIWGAIISVMSSRKQEVYRHMDHHFDLLH